MTETILAIITSAAIAVPITMGLGVVYFSVAIGIVNMFRLNYGEKPYGFKVLNSAVCLTIISYFVVFAVTLRKF